MIHDESSFLIGLKFLEWVITVGKQQRNKSQKYSSYKGV